jgi:heptosyltransferase-2
MRVGRRFEKAVRAVFVRALTRALAVPAADPAPLRSAPRLRVLLLRHDRVGDMILTSGLLRNLAPAGGRITLDVLASPANAGIARRQSWQGELLVLPEGRLRALALARRLRRRRYDAVVDGFLAWRRIGTMRVALMHAPGAPHRIGLAGAENDALYTMLLPRREGYHSVDLLASLAAPFGVEREGLDWHPLLPLTGEERAVAERAWEAAAPATAGSPEASAPQACRVLVNVSAGRDPKRRWPDERFADLVRHARTRHPESRIIVIGLPEEAGAIRQIASSGGGRALTPALWESFALIDSCDVFVTPDTGLLHAASALRTPVVGLFQSERTPWLPYGTDYRVVAAGAGKGFADIASRAVCAAMDGLLGKRLVGGTRRVTGDGR